MASLPEGTLANASVIRTAAKSPAKQTGIEGVIRRGIALDSIERTIWDAEVAAEKVTAGASARIAYRKRAKLMIVKFPMRALKLGAE